MRYKLLLTQLFAWITVICSAQDLIYNPGFEEGAIPVMAGQISLATHWSENPCIHGQFDPSGGASPDLYDKVAGGLLAPPLSFAGGINPHTGNRLVALTGNFADNGTIQNTQEMIKGKLVCNLKAGVYQVSFWARPDARYAQYPTIFNYQHNRIEVVLLQAAGCDNELVVFTSSAINSLTSWVQYSGSFTLTAAQAAKGYSRIAFRHITTGTPSANAISRREAKFEKTVFMDDVSLTGGNDMIFPPVTRTICEGNSVTIPNLCMNGEMTVSPMTGVAFLPPNPNWAEPHVGEIRFTPTQSTTYTINCKDGDCLKQGIITITVIPTPNHVRFFNITCGQSYTMNDMCPGYTLDSYNIENMNAQAPCNTSSDPGLVITGNSVTFNSKCSRKYTFVYRDANGCICKTTVYGTVFPFVPQPPITAQICKGAEFILNSPCSTSVALVHPNVPGEVTQLPGNQLLFKPSSTKTYTIFCAGDGIDPCIPTYELTINVIEPETLPDEYMATMCGDQVPLYPVDCPEGDCYIMTDPPTLFPANSVRYIYPKENTEVTIVCKDANGCIRRVKKVKITVEYPLTQHEAYTVCEGTDLTLTNPCDGGTIQKIEPAVPYTTQGSTIIISPGTSGPYKIYCMDANGCLSIHEYQVDVLPPSVVEHEAYSICYLQSLTIQHPCPEGTITKVEPQATYIIQGGQIVLQPILNEGEYRIYCVDANGCTTIHKYHIDYVPPTYVGYLIALCPNQPLVVDLPCPAENIFRVTPNVPYFVNGSSLTITADAEGSYQVHCVDANGCETIHEYLVEWVDPLHVGHEAYTICEGGTISVEDPCPDGDIFKIEPEVGFTRENGMVNFVPNVPGFYDIYCRDANGCVTIHTYQVDLEYPIDYEHRIICIGQTMENNIAKPEGCPDGVWLLNGIPVEANADGSITPVTLGTYNFKCKGADGCVTKNYYFDLINTEPCIPKTTIGKKICVDDLPTPEDNTLQEIVIGGVTYYVFWLPYTCLPAGQNLTPQWTYSGLNTGAAFFQPSGSVGAYVYVSQNLANGHHWTYTVRCLDDNGNVISETTFYIYKCGTPEVPLLQSKTNRSGTGGGKGVEEFNMLVAPNPSNGEFDVTITGRNNRADLSAGDGFISVIDGLGRVVMQRSIRAAEIEKDHLTVSLPAYVTTGMYYLRLEYSNHIFHEKISVLK